jgi:hypothetical protein
MTTNYVITGVWFQENYGGSKHISHVMLHAMNGNTVLTGKKTSKDVVIPLLPTKTIRTLKWNYKNGNWDWGALVTYETRLGVHYLRTVADADASNNLDNLINMNVLPL